MVDIVWLCVYSISCLLFPSIKLKTLVIRAQFYRILHLLGKHKIFGVRHAQAKIPCLPVKFAWQKRGTPSFRNCLLLIIYQR